MANRIIRDIPELVKTLREQAARCKDLVVGNNKLKFMVDDLGLFLSVDGKGAFQIQKQAHGQIGQKFGAIPMAYYSAMLERAKGLLATNLNHWRGVEMKKHLIRFIDADVRAVLSDRYRPISNLDILTTAVQAITGEGAAKGAQCFGWSVSPTAMDVCLMNPSMQLDLNELAKGIQFGRAGGYDPDAPNHGWVRPEKGDGGHWVFPAAFIGNSETGHGGLSVKIGLYEAICDNTARLGVNLAQRHLGKTLEEGEVYYSEETQRKENALVFVKVGDVMRNAFDPELLLKNAKRMKGLADEECDIREVVGQIVKLPGLTEDLRDDILSAYRPLSEGRKTLLDVQRAVTASAHAVREESPDKAIALEELGGAMIESGRAALAVK